MPDQPHHLGRGGLFQERYRLRFIYFVFVIDKLDFDQFVRGQGLVQRRRKRGCLTFLTDKDNRLEAMGQAAQIFPLITGQISHGMALSTSQLLDDIRQIGINAIDFLSHIIDARISA